MTELTLLAAEIGTTERSLRRAAARGAIRCLRRSPRPLLLAAEEYEYVRTYWPPIGRLIQELRTLPGVRLAVLYGSAARGEENAESDLDILVRFREDGVRSRARVGERLEAASGRKVQLVTVEDAPPLLLADVLRDGRVLVDRDGDWSRLKAREAGIELEARTAERELEHAAWAALEQLGVLERRTETIDGAGFRAGILARARFQPAAARSGTGLVRR